MTIRRQNILNQIDTEREYQDAKFGTKFDDNNTANDWTTYITQQVAKAAPLKMDHVAFRKAMIKTATVAVAALEALDRNGGLPERHYDK